MSNQWQINVQAKALNRGSTALSVPFVTVYLYFTLSTDVTEHRAAAVHNLHMNYLVNYFRVVYTFYYNNDYGKKFIFALSEFGYL